MKTPRINSKLSNKNRPNRVLIPATLLPIRYARIHDKRGADECVSAKPQIILERWSVVSQLLLVSVAFLTLLFAAWTFAATPIFRELLNPRPIIEAQVVESDDSSEIRLMLSNRGVASAAIRRAWLQVGGSNRHSDVDAMLLTLQDKDRFLPPGHMVLAVVRAKQELIPSLIEAHLPELPATNVLECTVVLEIISPDGSQIDMRTRFPCLYASIVRSPPN